jgi:hypothetical protein
MHATCPAHLILLDFITRTILNTWYYTIIICSAIKPMNPEINPDIVTAILKEGSLK